MGFLRLAVVVVKIVHVQTSFLSYSDCSEFPCLGGLRGRVVRIWVCRRISQQCGAVSLTPLVPTTTTSLHVLCRSGGATTQIIILQNASQECVRKNYGPSKKCCNATCPKKVVLLHKSAAKSKRTLKTITGLV